MSTLAIRTMFGEYTITAEVAQYANGNTAVQLYGWDDEFQFWEPFARLTVNLDKKLPEGMAYLDTNNLPCAAEFVESNGLGKFTGSYGYSGFCVYPLFDLDLDKIREYTVQ